MNDTNSTTSSTEEIKITRKQIGIRLLFALLYLIIFEVLKVAIQVIVLCQFVYLFITQKHSEPLRTFSNKVATYAYKLIRYVTLNDNTRPFPFNDFPPEIEGSEASVKFDS